MRVADAGPPRRPFAVSPVRTFYASRRHRLSQYAGFPSLSQALRRLAPTVRIAGATLGLLGLLLVVQGCAESQPAGGTDMPVCDGASCTPGGCDTDNDCKDGKKCDTVQHLCVAC